jgi:hypothetical protein
MSGEMSVNVTVNVQAMAHWGLLRQKQTNKQTQL